MGEGRRALGFYINNVLYINSPKGNMCQSTESISLKGLIPVVCIFRPLIAICNLRRQNVKGNTALLFLSKIMKFILI